MPRFWACPRCYEVVRGLLRVRWCEGLTDYGPEWMCSGCHEHLKELADGPTYGSLLDGRPHAITIIDTRGELAEAA